MRVDEVTTIKELKKYLIENGVNTDFGMLMKCCVSNAVSKYVFQVGDGDYVFINVDWDYNELDSLKELFLREALPEVMDKYQRKAPSRQKLYEDIVDIMNDKIEAGLDAYEYEKYAYDEFIDVIAEQIKKECESCDVDVPSIKNDIDRYEWYEYFSQELEIFVNPEIEKQLAGMEFDCNIICSVEPDESNGEFTSIPRTQMRLEEMLGEGKTENEILADERMKNYMHDLLELQGYSVDDFFVKEKHGKFADSLRYEYDNLFAEQAAVTILAKGSFDILLDYLSDDGDTHSVDTSAILGLYDPFCGGGGPLDVKLEKEITLHTKNVWDIQIEGKTKASTFARFGYNVQDAYGLVPECWRRCVR